MKFSSLSKKKIIIYFFILFNFSLNGNSQTLQRRGIELIPQISFTGTGDVWGPGFTIRYTNYFKKRFSYSLWAGCTIHSASDPLSFTDSLGRFYDISIRDVTGGIQCGSTIEYALIRSKKQEFKLGFGGLIRYQSTSLPDIVTVFYPAGTGIPFPVYVFQQESRQKTIAIGANVQIGYNFIFKNNLYIGVLSSWQMDSNGESILPTGLTVGKKF